MKKQLIGTLLVIVGLCSETATHGQGTYISNLDRPTTGSLSVASNAWLATWFRTESKKVSKRKGVEKVSVNGIDIL
jgi:hypothetical protein